MNGLLVGYHRRGRWTAEIRGRGARAVEARMAEWTATGRCKTATGGCKTGKRRRPENEKGRPFSGRPWRCGPTWNDYILIICYLFFSHSVFIAVVAGCYLCFNRFMISSLAALVILYYKHWPIFDGTMNSVLNLY